MIDRSNPQWYKDAVIYQLHIKAFLDSDNDGIGDFQGLTRCLDYVQDIGVNTIWLLPFYPSPLRDDGYDIANYRDINPSYGTMRDFRRFVRECHKRDLRVITELVINHTSDQHPWFQRARRAKPGSKYRNYYVWSDTDQIYQETRIIFLDTEVSNWTWDPVAGAYYWHRFYSHQPDLNFDNPAVLREVTQILRYWLDMGVDGLRLDAVPYLIEREGTNNENLPETHEVLKKIRAEVDRHYPDRMLLAEANQWPEDVLPYFGDADECHMAFHFPLMPRMYMAIAQEDRHPVTDIMRQTPEIPDGCQWAIFLRNHDELTLEMVTDRERDYLWEFYAKDRRMRINMGIRRRLAPLLDNDRRLIELMNSLLFSMPGSPVLYYGDEIGMGDNIYLGDRDGVRTPMQWSPDRNGGFSRADPAKLYLPTVQDPIYGFDAVNVEAQLRSPSSLLNWTRRIVAVRQAHKAFAQGSLRFLYPENRKVMAYLREYGDEVILCVCNVSRQAQAVELDLSRLKGRVPIELLGRSRFPPIGELPYLLTLPGYAFYWFLLTPESDSAALQESRAESTQDLVTLVMRDGLKSLVSGKTSRELTGEVLPSYLPAQRWFAAKDDPLQSVEVAAVAEFPTSEDTAYLTLIDARLKSGAEQRYFLPLAIAWDEVAGTSSWRLASHILARVRRAAHVGGLYDAPGSPAFVRALIRAARDDTAYPLQHGGNGQVRFSQIGGLADIVVEDDVEVRRIGGEQSNTSVLVGEDVLVKIYRRATEGRHPELEMGTYLTRNGYANIPPLLGAVEAELSGEGGVTTTLAVMHGFVRNQGDGWGFTLDYLSRRLEEHQFASHSDDDETAGSEEGWHGFYLNQVEILGRRVAEMHAVLGVERGDPAFDPEPITKTDLTRWRKAVTAELDKALKALKRGLGGLDEQTAAGAGALIERRDALVALIEESTTGASAGSGGAGFRMRFHGDLHLGQVLVAKNDWYLIDFEGEPERPLEERREKSSPMRDVAGMLRSFDYAAWSALARSVEGSDEDPGDDARDFLSDWRAGTRSAFLTGYDAAAEVAGLDTVPNTSDAEGLLTLFTVEKACYEILYELANRPAWVSIPVHGLLALTEAPKSRAG